MSDDRIMEKVRTQPGEPGRTDNQTFRMHEYSSRKLWEMVSAGGDSAATSQEELLAAVRELEQRKHYLAELKRLGKLTGG